MIIMTKVQKKILYILGIPSLGILLLLTLFIMFDQSAKVSTHRPSTSLHDDLKINSEPDEDTDAKSGPLNTTENTEDEYDDTFSLGDEVSVNEYIIKLGPTYSFSVVNNRFSDKYYGKQVVKLQFTQTNNSNKSGSFNFYGTTIYDPAGHETPWSVSALFDDSISHTGNIMHGVTQTTYLYFPYTGDGIYTVEIEDHRTFDSVTIIKLNIAQ